MSDESKSFHEKHGKNVSINPIIENEILKQKRAEGLPCAVAFKIADTLHVSPQAVGMTADLLDLKLIKCQMGLFGHRPNNKRIAAPEKVDADLKQAIENARTDNALPCAAAWEIARQLNIGKMTVSNACEALGIKIRHCQLGAF